MCLNMLIVVFQISTRYTIHLQYRESVSMIHIRSSVNGSDDGYEDECELARIAAESNLVC